MALYKLKVISLIENGSWASTAGKVMKGMLENAHNGFWSGGPPPLGYDVVDKKLVDIGGYGYCGRNVGGRWDFNTFDQSWAWGYQVLEIYDDTVRTYHVKTANRYIATNGCFDTVKTVEDEKKFTFIK